MKPLIGITPSPSLDQAGHGTFYRYCLSRTYIDSVRQAGGVPLILPTDTQDVAEIMPRLNGLLLSGGGDIDPSRYGDDDVHETTYGIDDERDAFEIAAFSWAAEHDLPTLCICRGIQVMAIAMGGSLIQDVPSQLSTAIEHRQHQDGKDRDQLGHAVTLSPGTPLAEAMETLHPMVNSFHHQAVRSTGAGLDVIAIADDGVIEGLWHRVMRFGVGVQWHPEMLAACHPQHAAIFRTFVSHAAMAPASAT